MVVSALHGHWKEWLNTVGQHGEDSIPVILHIGMEKTGTKAIQTWLARERDALNKQGWYIPRSLGKINHRQISFLGYSNSKRDDGTTKRGLKTNEKLRDFKKEVFRRLKAETKLAIETNQAAIIVSTELASSRLTKRKEINRMLKKMQQSGCNPILIVLFRRDPVEMMTSRHSTAILYEGYTGAHPPKAGTRKADLYADQISLQEKWWSVIRDMNGIDFDVHTYSKETLINQSSPATIASLLGCNQSMIEQAKVEVNQPLPLINLTGLRVSNMLMKRNQKRLKKLGTQLREYFINNRFLKGYKYKLPKRIREEYRAYYKESMVGQSSQLLLWSSWKAESKWKK